MSDAASPSQSSPPVAHNIDIGYASDSRGTPPPAVPDSLPVPTIGMDTNNHNISIPPSAGVVVATKPRNVKQRPSSKEKRGDHKLERAPEITNKFESVFTDNNCRAVEDRITR